MASKIASVSKTEHYKNRKEFKVRLEVKRKDHTGFFVGIRGGK